MEERKYINPLKVNNFTGQKAPDSHADPYVMKYNGEYYCYSTHGAGIPVFHSRDLVNWEYKCFALKKEDEKSFWAPAVIYNNGLFYMYYSSIKKEENDVHREFMKVAVSQNPEGPFVYQKTLFDNFSIDAHVTRDFSGDYYLYYTVSRYSGIDGQKPGTVILVDRLVDMLTPEGNPKEAILPTLEEEIFERNRFGDGRDWYCVEGPFHLTRNGREYLMFSGNAFTDYYYFVGYAVKDEKGQWRKYPNDHTYYPIIRKNEIVEGTGHNSVVRGPNNVDQWFIYHGRNILEKEDENGKLVKDKRVMRIDPLYWGGDKMWVDGPSYEENPAPYQPDFQDFFDGENGGRLSENWTVKEGSWECTDGQLAQNDLKKKAAVIADIETNCCVMEVSLKWAYSFMGGQYGVFASYKDENNYVIVQLDVGKRELTAFEIINGIKGSEIKAGINKDFDFECYHHLRINRTGANYQVFLDDLHMLDGIFSNSSAKVGLSTRYTKAYFDGFAVTKHLELTKGAEVEFLKAAKAENAGVGSECWTVNDGRLICKTGNYERLNEIILQNPCGHEYSFSVETSLLTQNGKGMIGAYLAYKDDKNNISLVLDNRNLSLTLINKQSGTDRTLAQYDLKELSINGLQENLHCITAFVRNGSLKVYLDEHKVFEGAANFQVQSVGLFCIGEAAFSAIQITGIN